MARGRMLSKSLSTSWKFAVCGASYEAAGHPHGEFPQLLFTLLVVHADDAYTGPCINDFHYLPISDGYRMLLGICLH